VQVDPVKPMLKPPGTNRLKLNSDELLSKCAFDFNLRRYCKGGKAAAPSTKKGRKESAMSAVRTYGAPSGKEVLVGRNSKGNEAGPATLNMLLATSSFIFQLSFLESNGII